NRAEIEARIAALRDEAESSSAVRESATSPGSGEQSTNLETPPQAQSNEGGPSAEAAQEEAEDAQKPQDGSTKPEQPEQKAAQEPRAAPSSASTGPSPAVWALATVSCIGIVTGTVFGFLALSKQSDFDASPSASAADEGEAFALVSDVSWGLSLASGVAAIVLYATEGKGKEKESSQRSGFVPTRSGGALRIHF
ncbi:MAG: hypothetical protein RMJ84_09000, partial [Sandaracinaceae bacterium]|nr:hypothetical protein [Sandaracinaceae bacterium]